MRETENEVKLLMKADVEFCGFCVCSNYAGLQKKIKSIHKPFLRSAIDGKWLHFFENTFASVVFFHFTYTRLLEFNLPQAKF